MAEAADMASGVQSGVDELDPMRDIERSVDEALKPDKGTTGPDGYPVSELDSERKDPPDRGGDKTL